MTFKNQSELFEWIWNSRPHVSEISGLALPDKRHAQHYWVYSHVLAKGAFPRFKLREDNIILMMPNEHHLWGSYPSVLESKPEWQFVFEQAELLKIEYFADRKGDYEKHSF
jgi:hypothetical protein